MRSEFRLDKLELYNVFNYRGTNVLDFTPGRKGNMYLFDVFNGGGKTSLFLSIKWGFYGFDSGVKYIKDGKVLNSNDFMNKFERSKDTFHVRIYFTFEGRKMELRRECVDTDTGKSVVRLTTPSGVLVDEDAAELIDSIIPQDCGDFFMFNGEILEDIANRQRDVLRSDGVIRMLGLKKIEILKTELENIKKSASAELTKCNRDTGSKINLASDLEETNSKVDELNNDLMNLNSDLKSNKNKRSKLAEERFKYANLESTVKALRNERDKKGSVQREIDQLRRNIQVDSPKAYLMFLRDDINKVIEDNEKKKPEIKRDKMLVDTLDNESLVFCKKVIARHLSHCPVCGSQITDEILAEFEERFSKKQKTAEELEALQKEERRLTRLNDVLKKNLKRIPSKIQDECTMLYEKTEELISIEGKIAHLEEISKDSDIDAVQNISKQLSSIDQIIRRQENEVADIERKIKVLDESAKKLEHQISLSNVHDSRAAELSKRISLLNTLIGRLSDVIGTITSSKRADILNEANSIFMDVTNKPYAYSGLAYNSSHDFSMHIVGKNGDIIESPSSGENHVIAFCFLLSLSKNTEHINPLVMDTPLSRLDMDHKKNMSRAFSKIENQILFLAQSGEIDPETMKYYEPLATKKFIAVPDENNEAHIEEAAL